MDQDRNEEGLVRRAQEGDLSAFDALATSLRNDLMSLAQRVLHDRSFAEDLVQETLLAAYKNLDQLEDASLFRPWIQAILKRRAWRWNESPTPAPLELNELDRLLIRRSQALAKGLWDRLETASVVWNLNEDDQQILQMAAVEGLSTREMSEATGTSEAAMKWRLHEARRRMRSAIEE